jgi:hypothetical protein
MAYVEYKTPEYQEIYTIPIRCKVKCPHKRTCWGWDGHMYNHHFAMGCKRCDAAFRVLAAEASKELING